MKYAILKASCTFSNGSRANIVYDESKVTEENACCDIEVFRKKLKENLNAKMAIVGITVNSINLTYEERDGRQ